MNEPTNRFTWGEEKSRQKLESPALIVMAAADCVFTTSQFNPYDAFLLFISFLLIALTADILFQRCANVKADESAWRELFERFQHSVDATIYHFINGRHAYLYNDVLQNFYERLLENDRRALHAFRGKTDAEARVYLCRIATSITIDLLRKEQRELPPYISLEEQTENFLARKAEIAEHAADNENYFLLRESIDACLEKVVGGKNRERNILIFKLMVYDGLSAKQIADIPGFSEVAPHAIDVLVSRIRTEVRECLDKK